MSTKVLVDKAINQIFSKAVCMSLTFNVMQALNLASYMYICTLRNLCTLETLEVMLLPIISCKLGTMLLDILSRSVQRLILLSGKTMMIYTVIF